MEHDDYIDGLCCDCKHDEVGFFGDFSENELCARKMEDGSCWENPVEKEN